MEVEERSDHARSQHQDAAYQRRQHGRGSEVSAPAQVSAVEDPQGGGLLMTVEELAVLYFGDVGPGGSASSNCQKIRRLIPDVLPARRIGNRWYVNRAVAKAWAAGSDPASVMAHPDTRAALAGGG